MLYNLGQIGNNLAMNQTIFPSHKGVVVHCEDKKVIAAVDCNGQKKLKSFHCKNKIVFWHFPFARGVQFFFCGIVGLLQALLMTNDLCGAIVVKKDKDELHAHYRKKLIFLGVAVVFGIVLSAVLLGFVPGRLGWLLVGADGNGFLRNLLIFVFKIAMLYGIFLLLRIFPAVNEFFAFNRAGELELRKIFDKMWKARQMKKLEKEVGAKKAAVRKNVDGKNLKTNSKVLKKDEKNGKNFAKNQKNSAKNEKKCKFLQFESINFLNFFVFVLFLDYLVVTLWGANYGFWFNLGLKLAVFLACMSIGYEVARVLANCRWLRWLAWLTGCLVFAKPTRTHTETVAVALTEINLLCTQKGREFMQDENNRAFSVVYAEVKNRLASAGVTDKSDADWLIATVLEKNRAEMKLVASVTEKQYDDIMKAVERRAKGESLDNIFGWTEFYGLEFDVNKKVLTPRMETELLVEQVLKNVKNYKKCTILDVGTGSGAIAIALAKNCEAAVTAVDVSKAALVTAQANAKKLGANVEFLHSNLFEGLKRKRKFDIIVSNPPYIPSSEIETLDKNVRECDPLLALDGGEDGLDFYREISAKAGARLNGGGMLFYEVGKGQAPAVKKIMKECGFEDIKIFKDYNNIERIVCGKFK